MSIHEYVAQRFDQIHHHISNTSNHLQQKLENRIISIEVMLDRILNINNKNATNQIERLLKEQETTNKQQIAQFTIEMEKLKDQNSNLREKAQEQLSKLQSKKDPLATAVMQCEEKAEKHIELAKNPIDTLSIEKERQLNELLIENNNLRSTLSKKNEEVADKVDELKKLQSNSTIEVAKLMDANASDREALEKAKAEISKFRSEINVFKDTSLRQKERAEIAEKQLQHKMTQNHGLLLENEILRGNIAELKSNNVNLSNELVSEKVATKKQINELILEVEKLKNINVSDLGAIEKAKGGINKLQSNKALLKNILPNQKTSAEVAEKLLQHKIIQNENPWPENEKVKREKAELKSEIGPKTKLPQKLSVNCSLNNEQDMVSLPQSTKGHETAAYTISIVYNKGAAQFKPVLSHILQLINVVLQPVTRKGYAKFNFICHVITEFRNATLEDGVDAVLTVAGLASNASKLLDRQIYGGLGIKFGRYEGQPDRRYVGILSTNQIIFPFNDANEMHNIPKEKLIEKNMSTLFLSNMKEKQLVSCDINDAVIIEISDWIIKLMIGIPSA